jgi:hypothetical protein
VPSKRTLRRLLKKVDAEPCPQRAPEAHQ